MNQSPLQITPDIIGSNRNKETNLNKASEHEPHGLIHAFSNILNHTASSQVS
jgi:hypothetical protein